MAIARVTSKGRVTIPLEIRKKLALETGSRVDFVLTPEAKVVVEPVHTSLQSLKGVFHRRGREPVSLGEMETAVAMEAGSGTPESPAPGATQ